MILDTAGGNDFCIYAWMNHRNNNMVSVCDFNRSPYDEFVVFGALKCSSGCGHNGQQ